MHRRLGLALLSLAHVALLALPAAGQCIPDDVSVFLSTAPERPTSRDDGLTLVFFGFSARCVPVFSSVERQEGLFVVHATQPEVGCDGERTRYQVAAEVGRLPSGGYSARLEIDNRSCVFPERSFRVRQGGARVGEGPAATLLFPYFAVDLADPQGETTTIGIGNASDRRVLANAVLWTDAAIPTLSFQIALDAGAVQPISLRAAFAQGRLPPDFCASRLLDPPRSEPLILGEEERVALVAAHTGRPHPADGLCYSSGQAGDRVATGYITVDVIEDCPDLQVFPSFQQTFPSIAGYLSSAGAGQAPRLISDRNALWGDLYQIDDSGANAQGFEAVAIPTDADVSSPTFYQRFTYAGDDHRLPLGHRYRARFLNGGGFQGSTDLIVWLDSVGPARPVPCGQDLEDPCHLGTARLFDQSGRAAPELMLPFIAGTRMLRIGGPELPTDLQFGSVELANAYIGACLTIPTGLEPVQAWVAPVLRARGRFSVGLRATRIE